MLYALNQWFPKWSISTSRGLCFLCIFVCCFLLYNRDKNCDYVTTLVLFGFIWLVAVFSIHFTFPLPLAIGGGAKSPCMKGDNKRQQVNRPQVAVNVLRRPRIYGAPFNGTHDAALFAETRLFPRVRGQEWCLLRCDSACEAVISLCKCTLFSRSSSVPRNSVPICVSATFSLNGGNYSTRPDRCGRLGDAVQWLIWGKWCKVMWALA